MRASWGPSRLLEGLFGRLMAFLARLTPSGAILGAYLNRLGAFLGRFGAVLEAILGRLEGRLGRLGALLGPSWEPLGRSWRPRGRFWGDLGGVFGRLEPSESRKEANAQILQKLKENERFWPLRALLENLLEASWAVLEASWANFEVSSTLFGRL